MNYLDIFNIVARAARPMHSAVSPATDMADRLEDLGLDSLDGLMMMMYLTDLYGIDEATSKEWAPETVQESHDLVMAHKTKEPTTLDEVREACK
jgi:acyl carrier protein